MTEPQPQEVSTDDRVMLYARRMLLMDQSLPELALKAERGLGRHELLRFRASMAWFDLPDEGEPGGVVDFTPPVPQDYRIVVERIEPPAEPDTRWWFADHYKSDRDYHVYCGECYRKIPQSIIRYADEMTNTESPAWEKLTCESCGKTSR